MTLLRTIRNEQAMDDYRARLGERLGWVVFKSLDSFAPAHLIRQDAEEGPVAIISDDVYLVDDEDPVFASEDEARDHYWRAKTS